MPTDFPISLGTVVAFALVLARVAGVFIFLPVPGVTAAPAPVRAILALSFTMALSGQWPNLSQADLALGSLLAWTLAEAVFGIAIGLAVSCVLEAFTMGAQMVSVQAGFSYASTIDPTTQADSTVLLVIAQLTAGLLFFAMGLDRRVLLAFSHSLTTHPPGSLSFSASMGTDIIQLVSGVFSTGFRLVMPVMALLLMLDVSLGLLGRLNSQLQVLTLAFPVKILSVLMLLATSVLLLPRAATPFIDVCFRLIARYTGP